MQKATNYFLFYGISVEYYQINIAVQCYKINIMFGTIKQRTLMQESKKPHSRNA